MKELSITLPLYNSEQERDAGTEEASCLHFPHMQVNFPGRVRRHPPPHVMYVPARRYEIYVYMYTLMYVYIYIFLTALGV